VLNYRIDNETVVSTNVQQYYLVKTNFVQTCYYNVPPFFFNWKFNCA